MGYCHFLFVLFVVLFFFFKRKTAYDMRISDWSSDVCSSDLRVFSFRSANHRWDPKSQRPELWRLYNARKAKGESMRVFPISNWTELDIWQYIHLEGIEIVPLYFSAPRPPVERAGLLLLVDDERFPLSAGEKPGRRSIRFRPLGCYPLTDRKSTRL